MVVPNTPHYNKMLWDVKHLIRLKPLQFPDGLPTEEDIGNIKIDVDRGQMRINAAFKIPQESLDKADTSPMFTGRYLREYLKWSSGLIGRSLPTHEVKHIDGGHIEEFDKQMKQYYNHQHVYYTK